MWIKALTSTFRILENCLLDIKTKEVVAILTTNDVPTAILAIHALRPFLESGFLDLLFTDEELAKTLLRPMADAVYAVFDRQSTYDGDDEDIESVVFSDEFSIDPDDLNPETALRYLKHYLNSITEPFTAIHKLTRRSALQRPMNAYLATLPEPVIEPVHIEQLKPDFIQSIIHRIDSSTDKFASSFLHNRLKTDAIVRKPALHAEAGMMAFACVSQPNELSAASRSKLEIDPESAEILTDVFSANEAAIGVSEACCWCCWRLHLWLREHTNNLRRPAPYVSCPKLLLVAVTPSSTLGILHSSASPSSSCEVF
ncbi:hypothetical protein BV25DRAFT_1656407 [Artomyces pyxidatus]|uniref:Uncharacterized protein n=1 Tax=Artomyces pyxidatus TaxID=48021 RepID=A0ACB8SJT7_9AGAM|nr:hypothetical protein BV25DRAFT_1656407 [Artomyces pyxidatus]